MEHQLYGCYVLVGCADKADEAFPGVLPNNPQPFKAAQRFANVIVSADGAANLFKVIVYTEVMSDKLAVDAVELQLSAALTNLNHVCPDNAVPPIADFRPSENLPAAERKIQVERDA
jgi:hypothetical protein